MTAQNDPRLTDIVNLLDSIANMTLDIESSDIEDAIDLLHRLEKKLLKSPELRDPIILEKCFAVLKDGKDADIQRAAFQLLMALSKDSPAFAAQFTAKFVDKAVLDDLGNPYAECSREVWAALEEISSNPANKSAAGAIVSEFSKQLAAADPDDSTQEEKVRILGIVGKHHADHVEEAGKTIIKAFEASTDYTVLQAALEALGQMGEAQTQKSKPFVDAIVAKMAVKDFSEKDFALEALARIGVKDSYAAAATMAESVRLLKARGEDEDYLAERAILSIAFLGENNPDLASDAIRSLAAGFHDESLPNAEATLRLATHFGLLNLSTAKVALSELSAAVTGPEALFDYFTAEIAVSGLVRIALTYPAFTGRVVETLAQSMATAEPRIREMLIQNLVRLSQPDPARWKNGLRDTFRRAAENGKVAKEVIAECETRVDHELSGSSPQNWERGKAFESARKLGL